MYALSLQLPPDELKKLEAALDPKQLRQAQFQIVKRTTTAVARIVQQKVRGESTINAKYVKRVITTIPPKGDPPVGRVVVKKQLLPLIAFKTRASVRGGVRVTISQSLPPVVLRHAFLATMRSGHAGVFLRSRHLPTKGPNAGAKGKRGMPLYKLTAQGFVGRLSIEEKFGPSVFQIVNVPSVLKSIEFDAEAFMAKQAASQLARFTAQIPITDAPSAADDDA